MKFCTLQYDIQSQTVVLESCNQCKIKGGNGSKHFFPIQENNDKVKERNIAPFIDFAIVH